MKHAYIFLLGVLFLSIHLDGQAQNKLSKLHPQIEEIVVTHSDAWVETYKFLHQNPEISFQEKNTSARLAAELTAMGYKVTENIGGYGIVGMFKNGEGPTVLIRADMDALPLEEKTDLPYASKVTTRDDAGNEVNAMHACGHDMHMTVFLGTAYTLMQMKDQWKGTLMMVGQAAEERSGGARQMIEDGLYKNFGVPDYAIALHCASTMPTGAVGYCEGYALASVDMVDIDIYGIGGHGAYPHTTIDPIILGTRMVQSMQTIVSREISPLEPAVVTVGSFHSGTKHNIISDHAKLQLTLRSYSDKVRKKTIEAIKRMCKHIALSAGLPEDKLPKVSVRAESTPATYNDPVLTKRLMGVSQSILGEKNTIATTPVMGGEDFSQFGRTKEKVPICIFWLGTISYEKIADSVAEGSTLPSLHSPFFYPIPKSTIETGVKAMTANALELLLKK